MSQPYILAFYVLCIFIVCGVSDAKNILSYDNVISIFKRNWEFELMKGKYIEFFYWNNKVNTGYGLIFIKKKIVLMRVYFIENYLKVATSI